MQLGRFGMINLDFWKGKKVFITGHTGFKGSWLSLWLKKIGAVVIGYSLDPPTNPSMYNLLDIRNIIDNDIRGNILEEEKISTALSYSGSEFVFHLAAQPIVRESYKYPVETYRTNVMGTINLLEAVRNSESVKSVVIVTSDKCYENNEWIWGYREDDKLGGYDPYSSSKAAAELVTASYRNSFFNKDTYLKEHSIAVATARAGNVIGGGDFAVDRLVPDIICAFRNKEKVTIRNPLAVRPWQHVLEPLSGYLMLAEKLFEEGVEYAGSWNFGPYFESIKTVEFIVKYMAELWGESTEYTLNKNILLHEANYLKLDISKAQQKLGWSPKWNLVETLEKTVEWEKNYDRIFDITMEQIDEYLK